MCILFDFVLLVGRLCCPFRHFRAVLPVAAAIITSFHYVKNHKQLWKLAVATDFNKICNCWIPSPSRAVSRSCGISWRSNVQNRRIQSRFNAVFGCSLAPRAPIGESYSVECYSRIRRNTRGCRVVNWSSHMLLAQRSCVFVPCPVR